MSFTQKSFFSFSFCILGREGGLQMVRTNKNQCYLSLLGCPGVWFWVLLVFFHWDDSNKLIFILLGVSRSLLMFSPSSKVSKPPSALVPCPLCLSLGTEQGWWAAVGLDLMQTWSGSRVCPCSNICRRGTVLYHITPLASANRLPVAHMLTLKIKHTRNLIYFNFSFSLADLSSWLCKARSDKNNISIQQVMVKEVKTLQTPIPLSLLSTAGSHWLHSRNHNFFPLLYDYFLEQLLVESQHLMKNETIPPGAIHQCPASIPGAAQPSIQDLQCSCEHSTAQDHHPPPRRGCSLSCPLCSASDSAQGESDRSIYSHDMRHPKPHTEILVKAVWNSCENSGSREGIQKSWL